MSHYFLRKNLIVKSKTESFSYWLHIKNIKKFVLKDKLVMQRIDDTNLVSMMADSNRHFLKTFYRIPIMNVWQVCPLTLHWPNIFKKIFEDRWYQFGFHGRLKNATFLRTNDGLPDIDCFLFLRTDGLFDGGQSVRIGTGCQILFFANFPRMTSLLPSSHFRLPPSFLVNYRVTRISGAKYNRCCRKEPCIDRLITLH